METEQWKQLDEFDGDYWVSSFGRLQSEKRGGRKFIKPYEFRNGYLHFKPYYGNTHRIESIHRTVAKAFIPNPENLPCVNHKDGNKLNNNVENLEWCTYSQNTQHAHDNNLMNLQRGNDHYETDHTIYYFHNPKIDRCFVGKRFELTKTYGVISNNLSRLVKKQIKSSQGWQLLAA